MQTPQSAVERFSTRRRGNRFKKTWAGSILGGRFHEAESGGEHPNGFDVSSGFMAKDYGAYSWRQVLDALLDLVLTATWVTGGIMNNICYEALCP